MGYAFGFKKKFKFSLVSVRNHQRNAKTLYLSRALYFLRPLYSRDLSWAYVQYISLLQLVMFQAIGRNIARSPNAIYIN